MPTNQPTTPHWRSRVTCQTCHGRGVVTPDTANGATGSEIDCPACGKAQCGTCEITLDPAAFWSPSRVDPTKLVCHTCEAMEAEAQTLGLHPTPTPEHRNTKPCVPLPDLDATTTLLTRAAETLSRPAGRNALWALADDLAAALTEATRPTPGSVDHGATAHEPPPVGIDIHSPDDGQVRLETSRVGWTLSPGEARSIARALISVADYAESTAATGSANQGATS